MKRNPVVLPLVHNALSTRFGDYLRLLEPELAARLDLSHITLVADKTVAQDLTSVVVAEVPFLAIPGHMTFLAMLLTEEPDPQELKRLTEHHLALAERLQKTTHVSVILLKQDHGNLARQILYVPAGLAALRWIKYSCWRLMGRVLAQSKVSAGRALFQPEDSAALADDICVGFGLLMEDDACRDSLIPALLRPQPPSTPSEDAGIRDTLRLMLEIPCCENTQTGCYQPHGTCCCPCRRCRCIDTASQVLRLEALVSQYLPELGYAVVVEAALRKQESDACRILALVGPNSVWFPEASGWYSLPGLRHCDRNGCEECGFRGWEIFNADETSGFLGEVQACDCGAYSSDEAAWKAARSAGLALDETGRLLSSETD